MQYSTNHCREILQKSAQLTSLRDEESLIRAFFEIMMGQFDELQSISLFKLERIHKDISLTVEAFQDRNSISGIAASESDVDAPEHLDEQGLNKDIFERLQQTILNNPELDENIESVSGNDFLIKKVNQDKQITFFMVYQFSESVSVELHNEGDSTVTLDKSASSIQLIRHLSEIYSNHQLLISMNDKDSLTGLYNRKFFDRKMNQLLQMNGHLLRRKVENNHAACLAILDIDHFKRINDTFGHLYGDEVLLHFAQQMQKIFRDDDWLFRYGGEEFVVILEHIDISSVEKILHRFRTHIESYNFPKVDQVTISIGVTQFDGHALQNEMIDRADLALYYIKEHGRNNVGCYKKLVNDGLIQEIVTEDDIELF